ncbi:hypothetical protein PAT3040_00202 [Paenibacillus agaridevorans]|uniref:Uncharacterized protein n=1 Tax=Paenibacillus agaridevorans TaxID=171404 RepID=A0A2R5EL69_9BACL|nr:hypothetical protein [Paenibacillus agaridevorans]GBG05718.1 hypothetical protein PAT3040_00202 [Paenibacillus agaridevorans]
MKRAIIAAILVLAAGSFIFWKWIGIGPTPMSDKELAARMINELNERADVSEVQDIVMLDSRHLFVPFVSTNGDYGMSFWVWDRFDWEIRSIDSDGNPQMWHLREDDPSKQYLVWNLAPESKVEELDFYLIRNRNAGRSDGNDFYSPRVQMEKGVSLQDQRYGVSRIPDDWIDIQKSVPKQQGTGGTLGIWEWSRTGVKDFRIGYVPTLSGEREATNNSSTWSSTYGNIHLSYIFPLNEDELEHP